MSKRGKPRYEPKEVEKKELKLFLGFQWWKNHSPETVADLAHTALQALEAKELWLDKYIAAKEQINRCKNLIAELTIEIDELRREYGNKP